MYKNLALLGAIALAGCTVDNSDSVQHSYTSEQYDAGTGVTLLPSENMWHSFPEIVNIYIDTEACMGMTAQGPDIVYRNFREYYHYDVFGPWASYHPGGLVQMNTDSDPASGFTRDKRTDTEAIKHEFIHHILNMNGMDWHHGDPVFALCGIGVNTYN